MLKRVFLLACFLLALSLSALAVPVSAVESQAVVPDNIQWNPNSDIVGVESAIAIGDPAGSELYVLLGKMDEGTVFPAHVHPDNRITTVLSGVMYYGTGAQFEPDNAQSYPTGSVVYTPAGLPHYMWSKDGELVAQETGFGPTGLEFMVADTESE